MFHALIDKITKEMKVVGSEWSADDWKRLLIDQWANETGRKLGKVAPSLDGQRVVQLGIQSHKFTKEEGLEFIEWLLCWMAENEYKLRTKKTLLFAWHEKLDWLILKGLFMRFTNLNTLPSLFSAEL